MMMFIVKFYIFFYVFTRFKAAHSFKEEDKKENTLNWFMIAPFALELFVISWIFWDLVEQKNENEDDEL